MDAGALPGEGPKERRRDGERKGIPVQEQEDPGRRGHLPDRRLQHVGRRHVPPEGWEHVQRRHRGLEEKVAAQQPRPPVVTSRPQQEDGAGAMAGEQEHHEGGRVAVRLPVGGPVPGQQPQRQPHLDRGEGHEERDGAARGAARGRERRRRGRRPTPGGVDGREEPGEPAEPVERAAFGGRREARTPLPLHVLAQRDGVDRLADHVPGTTLGHDDNPRPGGPRVARLPPGKAQQPRPGRTASGMSMRCPSGPTVGGTPAAGHRTTLPITDVRLVSIPSRTHAGSRPLAHRRSQPLWRSNKVSRASRSPRRACSRRCPSVEPRLAVAGDGPDEGGTCLGSMAAPRSCIGTGSRGKPRHQRDRGQRCARDRCPAALPTSGGRK